MTWRQRWFGAWCAGDRKIEAMLRDTEAWAKGAISRKLETPRVLILAGDQQTGKTRLGRAVREYFGTCAVETWSRGLWPHPPSVAFESWSELAMTEPAQREWRWQDVAEADLCILDDLGTEVDTYGRGRALENLRIMLERRLAPNRWTMITTNLPPTEWEEKFDGRITGRLTRDMQLIMTFGCAPWVKRRGN